MFFMLLLLVSASAQTMMTITSGAPFSDAACTTADASDPLQCQDCATSGNLQCQTYSGMTSSCTCTDNACGFDITVDVPTGMESFVCLAMMCTDMFNGQYTGASSPQCSGSSGGSSGGLGLGSGLGLGLGASVTPTFTPLDATLPTVMVTSSSFATEADCKAGTNALMAMPMGPYALGGCTTMSMMMGGVSAGDSSINMQCAGDGTDSVATINYDSTGDCTGQSVTSTDTNGECKDDGAGGWMKMTWAAGTCTGSSGGGSSSAAATSAIGALAAALFAFLW